MERISYSRYIEAHQNWCTYKEFEPKSMYERMLEFQKLIGSDEHNAIVWAPDGNGKFSGRHLDVTNKVAHWVKLLTSPHYHTLLKAYEVSRKNEK